MASGLTVKVHPVCFMSMVDAFERRINRQSDRALGTLLGFYEKNVVQITNCYSIPFRETNETQDIDDVFNKQMWNYYRRATPSEQIVGWFITVRELTEGCQLYHNYYTALVSDISTKKELPPLVLLTMDVNFDAAGEKRLPVRAYTQIDAGVPGKSAQASIFHPLNLELDCFPAEEVALNSIESGIMADHREIFMENNLKQLEATSEDMVQWLERVLNYVEEVLAKPEGSSSAEDSAFGRKLMNIVTTAATQIQPEKLDGLVKSSIRDFMMISYLSTLTKTQLSATQFATMHERP